MSPCHCGPVTSPTNSSEYLEIFNKPPGRHLAAQLALTDCRHLLFIPAGRSIRSDPVCLWPDAVKYFTVRFSVLNKTEQLAIFSQNKGGSTINVEYLGLTFSVRQSSLGFPKL